MSLLSRIQSRRFYVYVLISIILLHVLFYTTRMETFTFTDALWRWQECSYLLCGVNPFDIINQTRAPIASIGALPSIAGNVPWEFCWGNIFYPAFLPFSQALLVMLAEQAIATIVIALVVAKYIHSQNFSLTSVEIFILAFCLPVAQHGYISSLQWGNQGAIICILLALTCFLSERHPVLSGVLLGIAMCKPHTAILFFLPFLLKGEWKPILIASFITLLGWAAAVIATNTAPFEMLEQMGRVSNQPAYNRFGLIIGIEHLWPAQLAVLRLVNALLSLGLLGWLLIKVYRNGMQKDNLLIWSLFSVISIVWFYKQPHDYVILLLPMVYLLYNKRHTFFSLALIIFIISFPEIFHICSFIDYSVLRNFCQLDVSFLFSKSIDYIRPYAVLLLLPLLMQTAKEKHCHLSANNRS